MPLYEYHCSKCGKTFEKLQKFSDTPLTVHDDCGGTLEKLLSAPAFHLKGSGWYATDYAKGSGAGPKPAETKSDSSNETKSETKPAASETKSESKSESKTDSKPAATTTKTD